MQRQDSLHETEMMQPDIVIKPLQKEPTEMDLNSLLQEVESGARDVVVSLVLRTQIVFVTPTHEKRLRNTALYSRLTAGRSRPHAGPAANR